MHRLNIKELNMNAISSLIPFHTNFPQMQSVLASNPQSSENWDFYMTVAGCGVFMTAQKRTTKEQKEIYSQLESINPEMVPALQNFLEFNGKGKTDDQTMSGNVGIWVLWNVKGTAPTNEEYNVLALAIEKYLVRVVKELSY